MSKAQDTAGMEETNQHVPAEDIPTTSSYPKIYTHHVLIPRAYKPFSRFNPKRYNSTNLKTAETWLVEK